MLENTPPTQRLNEGSKTPFGDIARKAENIDRRKFSLGILGGLASTLGSSLMKKPPDQKPILKQENLSEYSKKLKNYFENHEKDISFVVQAISMLEQRLVLMGELFVSLDQPHKDQEVNILKNFIKKHIDSTFVTSYPFNIELKKQKNISIIELRDLKNYLDLEIIGNQYKTNSVNVKKIMT